MGIVRDAFRQSKGNLLGVVKVRAISEVSEIFELVLCPSVPPCQGGVGRESILAAVDLGSANDD